MASAYGLVLAVTCAKTKPCVRADSTDQANAARASHSPRVPESQHDNTLRMLSQRKRCRFPESPYGNAITRMCAQAADPLP